MKELDDTYDSIFKRRNQGVEALRLSLQRYASRTSEGQTRRALPQNAFAFFADRRQQKAVKDPLVQSHTGELAMAFSI